MLTGSRPVERSAIQGRREEDEDLGEPEAEAEVEQLGGDADGEEERQPHAAEHHASEAVRPADGRVRSRGLGRVGSRGGWVLHVGRRSAANSSVRGSVRQAYGTPRNEVLGREMLGRNNAPHVIGAPAGGVASRGLAVALLLAALRAGSARGRFPDRGAHRGSGVPDSRLPRAPSPDPVLLPRRRIVQYLGLNVFELVTGQPSASSPRCASSRTSACQRARRRRSTGCAPRTPTCSTRTCSYRERALRGARSAGRLYVDVMDFMAFDGAAARGTCTRSRRGRRGLRRPVGEGRALARLVGLPAGRHARERRRAARRRASRRGR